MTKLKLKNNVKIISGAMPPSIATPERTLVFFKVPKLCPLFLLIKAQKIPGLNNRYLP
jgi:hypothetical protein